MPKREDAPQPERSVPFNPLDKERLGKSVAEAFLSTDMHVLPPRERFAGAGVYAIYYLGDLPIYRGLVELNSKRSDPIPIYVGKAVPSGGRKGQKKLDASLGRSLYVRLDHHARSIKQTTNLRLSDFRCKYLIVDDVWIPLGESLLIRQFRPLWNVIVEGFGNNPTGGPRGSQRRSPWDTLHPGRSGVGQVTVESRKREDALKKEIDEHLAQESKS
jgi:hypothetical protein